MHRAMAPHATPSPTSKAKRRPARSRKGRARTRRIVYVGVVALLLLIVVVANKGPVTNYLEAREALAGEREQVAQLQVELEALQGQVNGASDPSRLEVQARQDLSYVRPGEEMFIVDGLPGEEEGTPGVSLQNDAGADGPADDAGPLERLVAFLCRLF
ncbi:MAG: hypothetical protein GXX83_01270 [Gaiellales bacterium]|nr:hypothetical protein [Gaiellales bacterium]